MTCKIMFAGQCIKEEDIHEGISRFKIPVKSYNKPVYYSMVFERILDTNYFEFKGIEE